MGAVGSGRPPDPRRRERIRSLWAQGLTTRAIARELGWTYEAVRQALAGLGLPHRGQPVACCSCSRCIAVVPAALPAVAPVLCLTCLADRPEATFAERLRAHRLAAGLTQVELGRRCGLDGSEIARWERGRVRPFRWNVERLARVLGPELESVATHL